MTIKNKSIIDYIFILTVITNMSCDDAGIALPGNYKENEPANPVGKMNWVIQNENSVGQLPEDLQGTNTILGVIGADDDNPDDEIETVTIQSQKVNGNDRAFFTIEQDSIGDWKLVLISTANIDYETVHTQNGSSTLTELIMEITDDSPSQSKGTLSASVLITNVNEMPIWGNFYISTVADEYIEYESSEITWSDFDLDDNHTLTSDNLPSWLSLDLNKLIGTPDSDDLGPNSFTLILTDLGGKFIDENFSINVRPNVAPGFSGSPNNTWEEERSDSWYITFTEQNSVDYSTLTAEVSSSLETYGLSYQHNGMSGIVSGTLSHTYVDQDVTFQITLNDNRNGNPLTATETFTITVDPNDTPNFSNANNILESINHGCQYYFDVNWSDPDGDYVTLTYDNDVAWLTINQSSGVMFGTPAESDIGSSGTVSLTITDNRPNVPKGTTHAFSIEVGENFTPEFTNSESVVTTATVGEEYSFQFAINDDNSDALTFSVPIKPAWLYVNYSDNRIYGTPNSSHVGTNDVTVKVEDCGASTSFDFSIEVSE